MSNPGILIGYLHEALATYRPHDEGFFERANDVVLASLPDDDAWPPLSRAMFSVTGEGWARGSFRNRRLIHFAGHFNFIANDLHPWLDKFEDVLRKLYWRRAEVMLLEDYCSPPLSISYTASPDAIVGYSSPDPRPPQRWGVKLYILDNRDADQMATESSPEMSDYDAYCAAARREYIRSLLATRRGRLHQE